MGKNEDFVVNSIEFVDCVAFVKQCNFSAPQMFSIVGNERNITFLKGLW